MTTKTTHTLYVAQGAQGSNEATLSRTILQYFADNRSVIDRMGIKVEFVKVTAKMQQDARVTTAFLSKGITKFPALVTSRDVYLGCNDITALFEKNIQMFLAPPPVVAPPPKKYQTYDDFLADEIGTIEDAQRDAQREDAVGESTEAMMAQLRAASDQRSEMEARRNPNRARARENEPDDRRVDMQEPAPAPRQAPRQAARQPAPPRQDNLENDDDEITRMLGRLNASSATAGSRERGTETLAKIAVPLGGDDDYDPQDDSLMRDHLGL